VSGERRAGKTHAQADHPRLPPASRKIFSSHRQNFSPSRQAEELGADGFRAANGGTHIK
jgi:hypothetical protein